MSDSLEGYKIGFIGLGAMGWPMACHLQDAGADLTVWNRSDGPARRAAERGMLVATDPAALAASVGPGILCLNLTHAHVVTDIVDILLTALSRDAIVVDFGTTGHSATLKCAAQIETRGATWIDAPVSGGEVGAREGSLTIMAGGTPENFARVLPLLEVVGAKISHMGPTGSGQVTKLANQLIVAQTIDAVAQALRLAEKAGVDPARVRDALRGGFAESRILELHGDRMIRRDFAPGGRSELQLKDVRLISELAEEVGLESPTLENSLAQWEKLVDERERGNLDHSGLFTLYDEEESACP